MSSALWTRRLLAARLEERVNDRNEPPRTSRGQHHARVISRAQISRDLLITRDKVVIMAEARTP